MKNYPNQASDFARLRATLRVIAEMRKSGQNVRDNAILGYKLARGHEYTFRNFDYSARDSVAKLEERIAAEQTKPAGNQGPQTNAREMRRTMLDLGLLDGDYQLTNEGQDLLASAPGSWQERSLLASALLGLTVTDNSNNSSHPVQVMLALLAAGPSLHRDGLELALEARDDSPEELARVIGLYRMPTQDRHGALGASPSTIANAKKIFPSLAKTAGLVFEDPSGIFHLSPDGLAAVGKTSDQARIAVRQTRSAPGSHATRRAVNASTIAKDSGLSSSAPPVPLTPEQQASSALLLAERTEKHQELVRRTAAVISVAGQLWEDPLSYDALFVPDDPATPLVLFEMKSIKDDAAAQVRRAVGQLSYYHYFYVSPDWPDRSVVEVAVFDMGIGHALAGYLASEDITAVVIDDQVHLINEVQPGLLESLGASPTSA